MTHNPLPPELIMAAVTMLTPYVSGLTPALLQRALETINAPNPTTEKESHPEKPFTRKEAAKALGVSVPTVDRYMSSGRLTRVRYSARAIRISAESVHNLMAHGAE